ncbi:MAG: DUF362 domain-containing protein [Deltaproteobacteria bacterium]|nr:DUF362 domain-containing protein [Deltaproteobacteria bacterium]
MSSEVYFADMRAGIRENLFDKLHLLLDRVGLSQKISAKDLVAIKMHFGERGNTAYIRPVFIRQIVDRLKALNARPFLTDANTLYVGARSDSVSHLNTAIENGFAYSVVGAPVIIADGLLGSSAVEVPVNGKHFETVSVGAEIAHADALISVAHFKGHELAGFGGAIKNVGMGSASRKGKLAQHSNVSPKVSKKRCIGCGECVDHCAQQAISIEEGEKSWIDPEKCVGCGECILVCPEGAINVQWNESIPVFMEKMVEYTKGVLKGKGPKSLFVNFLTQISPACDCYGHCDAPIVGDIGILASTDPVAIDQASVDLVNQRSIMAGSCLDGKDECVSDKFRGIYPQIDWKLQLEYAENIGLGSRAYELVAVKKEQPDKK